MKELRDKAAFYKTYSMVPILDISAAVVKSDSLLTHDLAAALRAGVHALEDVPEKDKDWHPGSEEKVLDLVHPSLFPLVYGRSRIIPSGAVTLENSIRRMGEGEIVPKPRVAASELEVGGASGGNFRA
jgi:hypothetical protein